MREPFSIFMAAHHRLLILKSLLAKDHLLVKGQKMPALYLLLGYDMARGITFFPSSPPPWEDFELSKELFNILGVRGPQLNPGPDH